MYRREGDYVSIHVYTIMEKTTEGFTTNYCLSYQDGTKRKGRQEYSGKETSF